MNLNIYNMIELIEIHPYLSIKEYYLPLQPLETDIIFTNTRYILYDMYLVPEQTN